MSIFIFLQKDKQYCQLSVQCKDIQTKVLSENAFITCSSKIYEFILLQALKAAGQIWLLSNFDSQEDIAYPNDPRVPIKVDDDLKLLFRGIELPRDMLDIEKDLQKNGMKPATNTAQRRARSEVQGLSSKSKPKKKKHEITKRTKLTNAHLPELFRNLNDNKS